MAATLAFIKTASLEVDSQSRSSCSEFMDILETLKNILNCFPEINECTTQSSRCMDGVCEDDINALKCYCVTGLESIENSTACPKCKHKSTIYSSQKKALERILSNQAKETRKRYSVLVLGSIIDRTFVLPSIFFVGMS